MSGYRGWRRLLKDVEKGRAHDEEPFLIEHLLCLLSEQMPDSPAGSPQPEGVEVPEVRASPALGETQAIPGRMSACVVSRVEAIFSCGEASQIGPQVSGAWEGGSGLMLLAFVL